MRAETAESWPADAVVTKSAQSSTHTGFKALLAA